MHKNAQASNPSAFFVDLFLSGCRSTLVRGFHGWARGESKKRNKNSMNRCTGRRNSTERAQYTENRGCA